MGMSAGEPASRSLEQELVMGDAVPVNTLKGVDPVVVELVYCIANSHFVAAHKKAAADMEVSAHIGVVVRIHPDCTAAGEAAENIPGQEAAVGTRHMEVAKIEGRATELEEDHNFLGSGQPSQ